MIASFGFTLSQAVPATAQDIAIPIGSILLPGDGSLVKSQEDPTVYLVSSQQRHSFTSAQVFLGLGFKFSSVLIVTNPELQALPKTDNLASSAVAHLPGLNINRSGTVFWLGYDNKLHPYSDLTSYNSWNIPNDFSVVVPANTQDISLPVGDEVVKRVVG